MPAFILRNRNQSLVEEMDRLDCDPTKLDNTYRQFRTINRWLSRWQSIYTRHIRPALAAGCTSILDLGGGGGDIAEYLISRAEKDGYRVKVCVADPDPRAVRYMYEQSYAHQIEIIHGDGGTLVDQRRTFDIVLSNNVLHHLSSEEIPEFLSTSLVLARQLAIHTDIRRDDVAYLLFAPGRIFFRNSFITRDGLISIRRSLSTAELSLMSEKSTDSWVVGTLWPYRNICIWKQ